MPLLMADQVSAGAEVTRPPYQYVTRRGSITFSPISDEPVSPTESTHLTDPGRSYGTLPAAARRPTKLSATRRTSSQLPILNTLRRARTNSLTPTPYSAGFRDLSFARLSARPLSTYDEPLQNADGKITDADAKVNGIRVWYASYTSIDWLHDAIKDSLRFSKLRRRKSFRSRLELMFDKSLGWIIVTIVGFLTAVIAFLVVRSEQLLFDLKEGYCSKSWIKAKRFCCPHLDEDEIAFGKLFEEHCPAWNSWSTVFFPSNGETGDEAVDYISYTVIAVRELPLLGRVVNDSFPQLLLASTSCLLTLYLTNSTTFIARKDTVSSGVPIQISKDGKTGEPKRKVMYYVSTFHLTTLSKTMNSPLGCW